MSRIMAFCVLVVALVVNSALVSIRRILNVSALRLRAGPLIHAHAAVIHVTVALPLPKH